MTTKEEIWQEWTGRYIDIENPVPLFETNENLTVEYKQYGQNDRRILKRDEAMESRLREEGRKVINDWSTTDDTYDGLIYLMYWLEDGQVVPLYIGKAGKYGRDGESLSSNLEDLRGSSTRKFARWGDAHFYHIGNLSAIIFDHEKNQKQKYRNWVDRLFEEDRQLKQQTYFWTKAWDQTDVGLYHDFEVPLEQLEYQLIGLASEIYEDRLLNEEGA
jgi:hypothetical protein